MARLREATLVILVDSDGVGSVHVLNASEARKLDKFEDLFSAIWSVGTKGDSLGYPATSISDAMRYIQTNNMKLSHEYFGLSY